MVSDRTWVVGDMGAVDMERSAVGKEDECQNEESARRWGENSCSGTSTESFRKIVATPKSANPDF